MPRCTKTDPNAQRDALILEIAQRQFRLETLETRNWNRLDFHDITVWAIRAALDEGRGRGASTLTQQVVKNVFLWHGRNWARKAAEAVLTAPVELVWTKRRILHVYLNTAEFGEGIFGVEAAAQHWFGTTAAELTPTQAARLAAVLPDPQNRNPAKPGPLVRRRTGQILSGAETIAADGRAACFEG